MKPNFVKVVFVIDESGSMYMSSKETINGINEFLQDGEENSSKEYTLDTVKDMIKEQEEKYNWTFVYLGIDITNMKDATSLGINHTASLSRGMTKGAYNMLSNVTSNYRSSFLDAEADMFLSKSLDNINAEYLNEQKSKSV